MHVINVLKIKIFNFFKEYIIVYFDILKKCLRCTR